MELLAVAARARSVTPMLLWVSALILVVIALGLIILFMRRRLLSKDSTDASAGLMDELRTLRDQGRISPEEYDAARRQMVAGFAGRKSAPPAPPASRPTPHPAPQPGEVRARPGFDLTGAPLPPSPPPRASPPE
jgi:hypothetical protein